jgi:hypothetical protein
MLLITKGVTDQTIIVSLSESKTITAPYYLFVFTLVGGSDIVNIIKFYSDDLSEYPDRFNEFDIDETLFSNVPAGQYSYSVYEQESSTNTVTTGLNKIECGKMVLNPATEITRDGYTTTTTVKGYAG